MACEQSYWKPVEKEMATLSSPLAWRIPWTEEPGGLQSTGSQRGRHDLVTKPPSRPPPPLDMRQGDTVTLWEGRVFQAEGATGAQALR